MDGKLLTDLKVSELKTELDRRELEKQGVKQILVERLKEALISEGLDPNSYLFQDLNVTKCDKSYTNLDNFGNVEIQENTHTDSEEIFEDSAPTALKEPDDTVSYVVHIEEPEEDLDYDIKGNNNIEESHTVSSQTKENESVSLELDSGNNVQQPNDQSNLRVNNLAKSTKAADLKQLFTAHGKVISAKILASTRWPRGCFGFLKMASAEDAASCILNLDGTEFNGNVIKIEVTDHEPPSSSIAETGTVLPRRIRGIRGGRRRNTRRRYRGVAYMLSRRHERYERAKESGFVTPFETRTLERASRMLANAPYLSSDQRIRLERGIKRSTTAEAKFEYTRNVQKMVHGNTHTSSRSTNDFPPPRSRQLTPPKVQYENRYTDYSNESKIEFSPRRSDLSTRRESEYKYRPSQSSRYEAEDSLHRQSSVGRSPFRQPVPVYQERIPPNRYNSQPRIYDRSVCRESPQTRHESNRYSNLGQKDDRRSLDSNNYPRPPRLDESRRSEDNRYWHNESIPNVNRSVESYERPRSSIPSQIPREHENRYDSSSSYRQSNGNSSEFPKKYRSSYDSESFPIRNNDRMRDVSMRHEPSSYGSNEINNSYRSEMMSNKWVAKSPQAYYDAGNDWRNNFASRSARY